jgi:hypothetical protein
MGKHVRLPPVRFGPAACALGQSSTLPSARRSAKSLIPGSADSELAIDAKRWCHEQELRSGVVMLGTILLIILILILIGSLPTWPYSGGWGYYPSGGFGLVVVIVIILLLMGRI